MDNYFITGGTGTLGKAILQRLDTVYSGLEEDAAVVTVFSRDPMRQANMPKYPNIEVKYVMGDVNNYQEVRSAMAGHQYVIHAAAMKHIPQGEAQVSYTIDANVQGSYNVARAALDNRVTVCTCISTDKACYPINVYGATKFLMENIWREFSEMQSYVAFSMCRYGNVLGSNGSVLPVWQRQRMNGQKITITDPHHIRYWMTVDDAVDVVFEALYKAPSGVTVIPIVPSLSIIDLASLVVGEDLTDDDIELIGERPGEKRAEWLLTDEESERASIVVPYYGSQTPESFGKYIYLYKQKVPYSTTRLRSDEAIDKEAVREKLVKIGVIK